MAIRVNQELVNDEVFLAEYRRLGGFNIDPNHASARRESDELRGLAERRVVGTVLLRQRAVASGITVSDEEIETIRKRQWGNSSSTFCGTGVLDALRGQLLVEKYCAGITRHEARPSRSEAEAFYRSHRERFYKPEQIKLIQVIRNVYFADDEVLANAAMAEAESALLAGRSFQQVAEEYSDCGGRTILGWIARGEMVAEFEDIAFSLSKGQRSNIFRTVFGLHIVHALDHRKAGYIAFDEVRSALAREIHESRKERRISAEIDEAIRSAVIFQIPTLTEAGASR